MKVWRNKAQVGEWDASDIEESTGACVHGVVAHLSPVKVSKRNSSVRYFNGQMSDGRKSVHLGVSVIEFFFAVACLLCFVCGVTSNMSNVKCRT